MLAEAQAALSQLSQVTTKEKKGVQALAASLSASASGQGGVLYSGRIGEVSAGAIANNIASALNLNILDNTARAQFLSDSAVKAKLVEVFRSAEGLSVEAAVSAADDFLFGKSLATIENSLWKLRGHITHCPDLPTASRWQYGTCTTQA